MVAPAKVRSKGNVVNGLDDGADRLRFGPSVRIVAVLEQENFAARTGIRVVTADGQHRRMLPRKRRVPRQTRGRHFQVHLLLQAPLR